MPLEEYMYPNKSCDGCKYEDGDDERCEYCIRYPEIELTDHYEEE